MRQLEPLRRGEQLQDRPPVQARELEARGGRALLLLRRFLPHRVPRLDDEGGEALRRAGQVLHVQPVRALPHAGAPLQERDDGRAPLRRRPLRQRVRGKGLALGTLHSRYSLRVGSKHGSVDESFSFSFNSNFSPTFLFGSDDKLAVGYLVTVSDWFPREPGTISADKKRHPFP